MAKSRVVNTFLLVILAIGIAMAQPRALRNAKKSLESGNIEEAQRAIEEAKAHPKTSGEAKTWYITFMIYGSLYHASVKPAGKISHCGNQLDAFTMMTGMEKSREYMPEMLSKIDSLGVDIDQMLEANMSSTLTVALLRHKLKITEILGKDKKELYFGMAQALRETGQTDSALRYYNLSIQHNQKLYESLTAKLDILSRQSRYEEFVDVLDIAAGLYPDDENIALAEVHYLIDKQLLIKARSLLTSYLNFQKNSGRGYLLLGQVNDQLHLTEESVDAYLKAIDLGESNFSAFFTIGKHFYQRGKLFMDDSMQMKAKEYLEMAESLQPDNDQLLGTLEKLYLDRRDITNYQRVRAKQNN